MQQECRVSKIAMKEDDNSDGRKLVLDIRLAIDSFPRLAQNVRLGISVHCQQRRTAMSPLRRRFVVGFISLLIGVHLVAIVGKIDEWPISYYGMFSRLQGEVIVLNGLYGVSTEGEEIELKKDAYWYPFDCPRLTHAIRKAKQRDSKVPARVADPSKRRVPGLVTHLMTHYEQRRVKGWHKGPPLNGLRVYAVTWRLDPTLSNLGQPEKRELVFEYLHPQ